MQLSERYANAVDYAREAHAGQVRKGTLIPYFSHVLGVSALVLEHGGNEDQAIAGLLHDVVEDCGSSHAGVIRERFGDAVAAIVQDCTDGTAEQKSTATDLADKRADWYQRKQCYIAHLEHADAASLLVSACDKLHNARAIVADLENPEVGARVFARFTAGTSGTLWYYDTLASVFERHGAAAARALRREVRRMQTFVAAIAD